MASSEDVETETKDDNKIDALVTKLSLDYSTYLNVDSGHEKKLTLDAIEDNLAHLEEFCGLIDLIRNDNTNCFEVVLPRVYEQSLALEPLYKDIDNLGEIVSTVKRTVLKMEEEVETAEKLLSKTVTVKKFFSSLFNSNNKKAYTIRRPKYVEPEIFNTGELFKASQPSNGVEKRSIDNSGEALHTNPDAS